MTLRMLSGDDKHAEIKRLYYSTTKQTIQQDLDKALDLLKSMGSEAERERVAVYMDGLAQMRAEWARADRRRQKPAGPSPATKTRRPAKAPRKAR